MRKQKHSRDNHHFRELRSIPFFEHVLPLEFYQFFEDQYLSQLGLTIFP